MEFPEELPVSDKSVIECIGISVIEKSVRIWVVTMTNVLIFTRWPSWHELPKSTIFIADRLGLHRRIFSGFRSQWMILSSVRYEIIWVSSLKLQKNWVTTHQVYLKITVPCTIAGRTFASDSATLLENLYCAAGRRDCMIAAQTPNISGYAT